MLIQLDLFETREESEQKAIMKKLDDMQESLTKIRKCQFAKIGEMKKLYNDIDHRLSMIEKYICEGKCTQSI